MTTDDRYRPIEGAVSSPSIVAIESVTSAAIQALLLRTSIALLGANHTVIDSLMPSILSDIGTVIGVQRAYIITASRYDHFSYLRHSWTADPSESESMVNRSFPVERFMWYARQLGNKQTVSVADRTALPPEARHERVDLLSRGVQALVAVPILADEVAIGALVLESTTAPRQWQEHEMAGMNTLGNVISLNWQRIAGELRLVAAQYAAEEADRAKTHFLANISHEIRTPMNAVMGLSEILMLSDLTAEQLSLATTIRSSGEALLTTLDSILDFSRMNMGTLVLEQQRTDLYATIRNVAAVLEIRATAKGLAFSLTIDPEVPDQVITDPTRLRQVLGNLLDNAVRFTAAGSVGLVVTTEYRTAQISNVLFQVFDTGEGVARDKRHLIFHPFRQAEENNARRYGGVGLGLSICKEIVRLMGGQLGYRPAVPHGAEFWFTVPFNRCD